MNEQHIEFLKQNYSKMGSIWCAKQLNSSPYSISQLAFKCNIKISKEDKSNLYSSFNSIPFLNPNTPEVCYVLGLIWADGHVDKYTNRVSISLISTDLLNIKDIISKTGSWKFEERFPKDRKPIIYARVCNFTFSKFLKENDYTTKSGVSANKILSIIPDHLKHYWFRGLFDGDGHFSFKTALKYSFGISSCYNQDWNYVEELFKKLNIKYFISNVQREHGNTSEIDVSNYHGVETFGNYIYQGIQFGLLRKYNKFLLLKQSKIRK